MCYSESKFTFTKLILNKYKVNYYECNACKSLQTEEPYWTTELYENSNLVKEDFGVMYRLFRNQEKIFILSKLLGLKKGLDWGGGDGILCRSLRDYCLNFYTVDKFTNSSYAQEFIISDYSSLDLITSLEVFEHLDKPKNDIDFLFNLNSKTIFIQSKLYKNQNKDWDYLYADHGEHIFFYSEIALEAIAKKFNYELKIYNNEYSLFYKKNCLSKFKLFLFSLIFNKYITKLVRIFLSIYPTRGIQKDIKNFIKS